MELPTFYNKSQLARHLGISTDTLRDRIATGAIKHSAQDGRGEPLFSDPGNIVVGRWAKKKQKKGGK